MHPSKSKVKAVQNGGNVQNKVMQSNQGTKIVTQERKETTAVTLPAITVSTAPEALRTTYGDERGTTSQTIPILIENESKLSCQVMLDPPLQLYKQHQKPAVLILN